MHLDRTVGSREGARLVPLGERDLDFVVRQHLTHFPDGFFAKLGRRFLREYYRSYLHCSGAVILLALRGAEPVGYLAGAVDPMEHRRCLLRRHGKRLTAHALWAMVGKPRVALLFLRTRAVRYARRLLRSTPSGGGQATSTPAVLGYVGVSPSAQGEGVGSALVWRFEEEARYAGRDEVLLVTGADGRGAERFYAKEGWTRGDEHTTTDGRRLVTFTKPLS